MLVVGAIVAGNVGDSFEQERVVYESLPLHNLYDDSRLDGDFFLGTGSVSEPDFFFYNYITPDGMIKPAKIYKFDEDLFILEDGAENPRIEKSMLQFSDPQAWLWGFHEIGSKTIFHIPPGSIDSHFSVK